MKLTEKTKLYSRENRHFTGRYKSHSVDINYVKYNPLIENLMPYWYFSCTNTKTDDSYSSLWNKLKFKTQQECVDAAIKFIDESSQKKGGINIG